MLHHVTVDLLRGSFFSLKRKAAPGIDGQTWQQYEGDLESRIVRLHEDVHRGSYRALPSNRVFIPKPDGPIVMHASTRKSVACFGAVNLSTGRFVYQMCPVFNGE